MHMIPENLKLLCKRQEQLLPPKRTESEAKCQTVSLYVHHFTFEALLLMTISA